MLRISLAPQGEGKRDPKYPLSQVLLYVPNLRLEPPATGPDGQPTEAHARITKDQAKQILDALWNMGFFDGATVPRPAGPARAGPTGNRARRDRAGSTSGPGSGFPPPSRKLDRTAPHVLLAFRYQGGEDPTQRELVCPWVPDMLQLLDAIRACVDGDAAKALDRLLAQFAEDRKKWAPDPLDEDLKKLQGLGRRGARRPPPGGRGDRPDGQVHHRRQDHHA